jgi:protease-4
MYLADALSWIGVKPEMVQIGDYKGANEEYMNAAPSKAWDQNINQLLDSLYGTMRSELKRGRCMNDERLDEALKRAWMADAQEAIDVGLIDAAVDLPELGTYITGKPDAEWVDLDANAESALHVDTSNPFTAIPALMKALAEPPHHTPTGPAIAVVHIDGAIGDGDSSPGGLFGEDTVGSRTIRNALEEIRDESNIKGVIVRIDSPGGSAMASEVIWQGVRRLAEKKPVWVSVGSMAASGGYYIAVAGDKIYLNPSSIVGSIGVVGGKFAMGGLLEKVKVHVVERSRGPMGDMFSTSVPWTPEQLAQMKAKMKRTYDLFTKRVTAGRKGIDLATTAEGRLFSGQKAIDMKLADRLGSLDDCIGDMADDLKLEDYEVLDYPGPKSFEDLLKDMADRFGVTAATRAPAVRGAGPSSALRAEVSALGSELLGERGWRQVRSSLGAMMQLRKEPVILALPRAIIVR